MGGIASVTRSCLAALAGNRKISRGGKEESCPRVSRLIRLRDPDPALSGLESPPLDLDVRNCGGMRRKCLGEIARQIVERPDLLIYEHVDLAQCQTMIPRALRRPYLVWGHGIELWRPLPPRKERALREADALLFNSAFTREYAGTFHPWILECPCRVVPLCREEGGQSFPNAAVSADPGRKPWILTVGRLQEDRPKGHLEILAALPELLQRVPELHWHVVGSGPWRETLAAMVEASPARDHITLHGFLDQTMLDRLFRQSRVFAMTSYGEGFGLVYAEAMSHGLPCVGSTLDAAPEVIGPAGTCLDPRDTPLLIETLAESLLAKPDEFLKKSSIALERAHFFELERFAMDLRDAICELSKARPRQSSPRR
jgi:glycosyltransferase involved in cell wall biosynthesis